MTIKYIFADGTVSVADVNDKIGSIIIECNRQEENLSRKERYHCISIEDALHKGKDFGDGKTPETALQKKFDDENDKNRIYSALNKLTKTQRKRLLLLAEGFTMREIACMEKVNVNAVEKSIYAARKKFKKFF